MTRRCDTSSQVTQREGRDIAREPEMIELKRMIRSGELNAARIRKGKAVMKKSKADAVTWKALTVRVPAEVHRALKVRAAEEGKSVAIIVEGLVRQYLVNGKQS